MEVLLDSFADGLNVARRNMIKVIRVPEILVSVIITPVIMVVMFTYVFGGAIDIPGGSYREFLVAGAFAMSLSFGATFTGAGLAEDMQKGIIDRFRSLPMSRSAVVFGRTASDVLYNVLTLAVMAGAALLVGWRIHNGVWSAVTGFALLLGFAYAISWIMAYVALLVRTPEVVNNAAMMVIFPMTFLANTFVPSETLPGPLRAFAEWNPVSSVAQAARELFGNVPPGTPQPTVWSLQNPGLYTLIWVGIIVAIFAPLAVWRYRTMSR
ncbi:MAG TPA: ABC transporter permease [Acidimicrobiia bacterium]|nr:ABC transporter permease [Acidimicrobiia bacterium]